MRHSQRVMSLVQQFTTNSLSEHWIFASSPEVSHRFLVKLEFIFSVLCFSCNFYRLSKFKSFNCTAILLHYNTAFLQSRIDRTSSGVYRRLPIVTNSIANSSFTENKVSLGQRFSNCGPRVLPLWSF